MFIIKPLFFLLYSTFRAHLKVCHSVDWDSEKWCILFETVWKTNEKILSNSHRAEKKISNKNGCTAGINEHLQTAYHSLRYSLIFFSRLLSNNNLCLLFGGKYPCILHNHTHRHTHVHTINIKSFFFLYVVYF